VGGEKTDRGACRARTRVPRGVQTPAVVLSRNGAGRPVARVRVSRRRPSVVVAEVSGGAPQGRAAAGARAVRARRAPGTGVPCALCAAHTRSLHAAAGTESEAASRCWPGQRCRSAFGALCAHGTDDTARRTPAAMRAALLFALLATLLLGCHANVKLEGKSQRRLSAHLVAAS